MDQRDLRIGDLILVRGTGFISEAIEAVEHSQYSHVAGFVGHKELIEAEGFRQTGYAPVSKYKGQADVFRCMFADRESRQNILEHATYQVGGRYDYALLFVELIRYWTRILLPYKEPSNARICSVLWADIYRDIGIDLCPGIKYPSPADVAGSKLLIKIGSL
ncbi:hypothetical protein [Desulfosporosinus sp. FKA]|uniref:hypothetical protein n=1 Tax=Desulfosporosinus sp. FKA TaxID=1969834 RepID=UPI000B49F9CE|nr:hypothetical protein [Desulfosporosinus sp. FKA]